MCTLSPRCSCVRRLARAEDHRSLQQTASLGPPCLDPIRGLLIACNIVFYAFHIGCTLPGIVLAFTMRHNPLAFLPYWIVAQYAQSLLFWHEQRFLMPIYPLLILLAATWYWSRRCVRRGPVGEVPLEPLQGR